MTVSETRQTARYERKREAILDAAVRLFNARGLNGTTLADVAQSVQLTTTSVTYYYRRKEDLAAGCIARAVEEMEELLTIVESEVTPQARLRRFVVLYFEIQAQVALGARTAIISFWDLRALTGPSAEAANQAVAHLFRRFRHWFAGSAGPVLSRAEQNARTFLVFVSFLYAKEWLDKFEVDDYPRCANSFADVLINGLAAPGHDRTETEAAQAIEFAPIAEASNEAFLRAATALINEQGYRGASVDRISARLSVTKGSFYHHNETKNDLVAQCFGRTFDVVRAAHSAATPDKGNGWTRLYMVASALARYQRSDRGPLLHNMALAAMPEAMRPQLIEDHHRLVHRTAGVIVDGIADGSIRPVDQIVAAHFVSGMINNAVELHHWVHDVTDEGVVALYVRPALSGVFSASSQG